MNPKLISPFETRISGYSTIFICFAEKEDQKILLVD
uniref:MBL fold metallo-hydrolase n=1 Tax=Arundo donax TaxID=35708 RepID=A0A0A9GM26_ARUDO